MANLLAIGYFAVVSLLKIRQLNELSRGVGPLKKKRVHYHAHAYRGQASVEIHKRELALEGERDRVRRLKEENRKLRRENHRLRERNRLFRVKRKLPFVLGALGIFGAGFFMGVTLWSAGAPSSRPVNRDYETPRPEAPAERVRAPAMPAMCRDYEAHIQLQLIFADNYVLRQETRIIRFQPSMFSENMYHFYAPMDCLIFTCPIDEMTAGGETYAAYAAAPTMLLH